MHISIATYPTSELDREAAMLKMSLLYADTVTLYSVPLSIYLGLANAADSLEHKKKLEHFIRLRPLVGRQDMADIEQEIFQGYKDAIQMEEAREALAKYKRTRREIPPALRGVLQQRIKHKKFIETYIDGEWAKVSEYLSNISREVRLDLGLENYTKIVRLGLLDVDKMDIDELDALEFSLRAQNGLDLTDMLEVPSRRFTEILMQLLFTPSKTYPLLDTQIGELLRIQPEFKEVTVSKVQAQKAKHAGLASSLFEQLPTFNEVTLDEILGIRKELSNSLIAFRGAVAEYTELLESDVWNEDFDAEADKVYEEKVRPAVEAIRLKVEKQSALKGLARVSENSIPALAMGALATGEEFLTSAFQRLVALGFIAFNTVVEAKGRKRRWNNLEHEKIFFYYKMSERYKG